MTELVTGQNLPWPGPRLTVRLHGRADLSALLLGADALVRDDSDLVFYNAPATDAVSWRAVGEQEQQVEVELARVPAAIDRVRLLVSVDEDQPALGSHPVTVSCHGEDGTEIRYAPAALAGERCLIWFELYRRSGGWKVRAVGQGWRDGLAAALTAHGIAVEQAEPVDQAPVPPGSQAGAPSVPMPQPYAHPSGPPATAATPGPDDDTVAGALRAIRSLRQDLSQARRAHRTAVDYAADKLMTAQENARSGVAVPLEQVQAECMALVAQADERYDREAAALRAELVAEEFAMPLPLARLDSLDWETFSATSTTTTAASAIDTHDRTAEIIRLGSIYSTEREPLRLPMPHAWGARTLVWAQVRDQAPTGPAWVHGIIARMTALCPSGGFEVQMVDVDGSLTGALGPHPTTDITVHRTPAELARFVDQLAHHCDMAKMAVESRIPETLDDVRDGARHLVVLGGWPHGYDERTQQRIVDCLDWGYPLALQFIALCDESDIEDAVSPDSGRDAGEMAQHPMARLLSKSTWLDDGPRPGLTDEAGVEWCFDPELTPGAREVASRITSAGPTS